MKITKSQLKKLIHEALSSEQEDLLEAEDPLQAISAAMAIPKVKAALLSVKTKEAAQQLILKVLSALPGNLRLNGGYALKDSTWASNAATALGAPDQEPAPDAAPAAEEK